MDGRVEADVCLDSRFVVESPSRVKAAAAAGRMSRFQNEDFLKPIADSSETVLDYLLCVIRLQSSSTRCIRGWKLRSRLRLRISISWWILLGGASVSSGRHSCADDFCFVALRIRYSYSTYDS